MKNSFLPQIDPTALNPTGTRLEKNQIYCLDLFLKQQEEKNQHPGFFKRLFSFFIRKKNKTFYKDTPYTIQIPNRKKPVTFTLTHNITIIPHKLRDIQKRFSEYLVLDDKKDNIIGEGGHGTATRAEGLLIREQGSLIFTRKNILDKVQHHSIIFDTRNEAKREAKILSKIHQGVKPIVFERGPFGELKSHLVDQNLGITLKKFVHDPKYKNLSPKKRWEVTINLLQKIQALHRLGYIHHDLKPSNIVIIPETLEVNLIDCGSAKKMSHWHQFGGDPKFIAPEKFLFWKYPVDKRADIYSAGLVLAYLWGKVHRKKFSFFSAIKHFIFKGSEPFLLDSIDPPEIRDLLKNHILQFDPDQRKPLDSLVHQCEEMRLQFKFSNESQLKESAQKSYYLAANCAKKLIKKEHKSSANTLVKLEHILRDAIEQLDESRLQLNEFIHSSGINAFKKYKNTTKAELLRQTKTIITSFSQHSIALINLHNHLSSMLKFAKQRPGSMAQPYLDFLETRLQDVYRLIYEKENAKTKLDDMVEFNDHFEKTLDPAKKDLLAIEKQIDFQSFQSQRTILLRLNLEEEKDEITYVKNRIRLAVGHYLTNAFTARDIKRSDRAASARRVANMNRILDKLDTANDKTVTVARLTQNIEHSLKEIECGFFGRSQLRDLVEKAVRVERRM